MYRIATHFLFLLLLCISSFGYAQTPDEVIEMQLKTGKKILPQEILLQHTPSELVNGKYYRYLQFSNLPNLADKQLLKNAGVELLDYIPDHTYIAAIPSHLDQSFFSSLDVQAISPIATQDKISIDIGHSTVESQDLMLQFQKNINEEQAQCFLEDNHIEITGPYSQNHTFPISTTFAVLERIITKPIILFVEKPSEIIKREDNLGNAQHRSNTLVTRFQSGRHYDGTDVNVAIGDDGPVGPHIDFANRIADDNASFSDQNTHGDMVAGILAGAGNLDPEIQGVAKGAQLHIVNGFETVEKAMALYENESVVITSTSYGDGCNRGYTTFTQLADQQIFETPALIHVFSAGNAGDQDCEYGAGAGWGNITGGVKVGKNVIAVGNVDANDELVFNSSRGPSNDGRIKPDICANGEGQMSTAPNHSFQLSSGSSAAAPVISGILAQLYQAYKAMNNGENPESALMKAILLNSADDLGNPGPDYSFGWGRVNALRAIQTLEESHYFSGTIEQGESLTFDLDVPADAQNLKVMLYWSDKEGSTVSSKSLVNDLDLHVKNGNVLYLPWHLDPSPNSSTLNQPATHGADHLNNMEQVQIQNPVADNHQIVVNGFKIPFDAQKFYVIYEYQTEAVQLTYPFGGEHLNQGTPIRIHWDAVSNDGVFQLDFSSNNGQSWETIANVSGSKRLFDWTNPEIITPKAMIRISRNGFSSQNEVPFHIYTKPTELEIIQVCPDFVSLQWQPSTNASAYTIYSINDQYMDSIGTSTLTNFDVPIDNPETSYWFAVSAVHENGAQSQRTIAINNGDELVDCVLQNDLSLINIAHPLTNAIHSCYDQNIEIALNVKNEGTVFQSGFKLFYQYDDQAPVVEEYPGLIPPGITVNHVFQTTLDPGDIGEHELKTWAASNEDQALYNDTLTFNLSIIPSTLVTIPYFQNFDDFDQCLAGGKCSTPCNLSSGWFNANNEFEDAIDWKTNRGNTTTFGTGPQTDQNSNTESGQYLYLEGSPGCFNSESVLYSPCIDLSTSIEPLLSFWYHMSGSNMGSLHLDLFDGTTWYSNIMTPVSGHQGPDWKKVEIDLTSFSGNIVNLKIRGYTGEGYLTDMAIDNFSIVETAAPPVADFILERHLVCTDQTVQLFDNSYNDPLEWEWNIEPAGFTFIGGTSANSPNPSIAFETTGVYSITLNTSNAYGNDEIVKYDIIVVSDGLAIPYAEDFNNTPIPSSNWKIENSDQQKSWENISIISKSGQETNAIYLNNHSYNAPGEEDALVSKVIDLTNAEHPFMRFDLSYAPFNQYFVDGLRIELSDDCQASYSNVIYEKFGNTLATAAPQMTGWTPHDVNDWRTETIDLSAYIGSKISVKFINTCGFGNNLYLDNIAFYEYEDFPKPDFSLSSEADQYCLGEAIVFENQSEGLNLTAFEWSFGTAADLDSVNTVGPHVITFNETGTFDVSLKAFNDIGWDQKIKTIEIIDAPVSDFSYIIDGGMVSFNSQASFGTNHFWDFGDGHYSTEENPVHIFNNSSTYNIQLLVQNNCGESTSEQSFVITSTHSSAQNFHYSVHPNPTDQYLNVELYSPNTLDLEFSFLTITGKAVFNRVLKNQSGKSNQTFDVRTIPAGIYLLQIKGDRKVVTQKVIVL